LKSFIKQHEPIFISLLDKKNKQEKEEIKKTLAICGIDFKKEKIF